MMEVLKMNFFFTSPAQEWEETLPIGNGSLGGMIFGSFPEKIGLNDESLWSGYEYDKNRPEAANYLSEIQQAILEGRYLEAGQQVEESFLGNYTESYLPLGNLIITQPHQQGAIDQYRRCLDLSRSKVEITYQGTRGVYQREYFASYPDQALWGRFIAPEAESISIAYESQLHSKVVYHANESCVEIQVQCPEHVNPNYISNEWDFVQGTRGETHIYELIIEQTDGNLVFNNDRLIIENARNVSFLFRRKGAGKVPSFVEAKKRHRKDYQELFNRVEMYLGDQVQLPLNERIARVKEGQLDPGLIALYFQYGRYLLISSSRPGSLPSNLQGIWSWQLRAPWSCNFTTNINLEMNYWLADTCNLHECFVPYSNFIEQLSSAGEKTAFLHYGVAGSVCHHNTDRWFTTNPVGTPYRSQTGRGDASWAMWQMGGAWLASDLYRHYEYTGDRTYLKEVVYPVLRKSVMFLVNTLIESDGIYHSCPSTSPENLFFDAAGNKCSLQLSTAMDICLINENFDFFRLTCESLNIHDDLLDRMKRIQPYLATVKIGSKGQILEWQEEFEEVEPGHRHVSHLYGAYPGELYRTEELLNAVRKSISLRLKNGGGHTGWSNAWLINLFAILGDSQQAYQHIQHAILEASYSNLWSKHPPFQIDGNFGVAAGIANLFIQDRNGHVKWLPSLPAELKDGFVKGLKIKGNQTVEMQWKNGELIRKNIY